MIDKKPQENRAELHLMYCLERVEGKNNIPLGMPLTMGGNLANFLIPVAQESALLYMGLERVQFDQALTLRKISETGMVLRLTEEELAECPGLRPYNEKLVKRLVYIKDDGK